MSFRCEIDSGDAVLLRINRSSSSSSSRLMFEMLPGYHTQNLVAEIFRQTENASKAPPSSSNVEWADKFLAAGAEGTAEAAGKEGELLCWLQQPLVAVPVRGYFCNVGISKPSCCCCPCLSTCGKKK